jgi:hypothetical protein
MDMFNTINQQEQPFIQGGYAANNRLQYLLGLSGSSGGSQPLDYNSWVAQQGGGTAAPGRMPMSVDGVPMGRLMSGAGGAGGDTSRASYELPARGWWWSGWGLWIAHTVFQSG